MQLVSHSPSDSVYAPAGDYAHAMEVRGASRLLFLFQTLSSDWLVEIEVIAAA